MSLKAKLEAVIYAAEEPVTLAQLAALFAAEAFEWKNEQTLNSEQAAAVASAEVVESLPLISDQLASLGIDAAVLEEFTPAPVAEADPEATPAPDPETSQDAAPDAAPEPAPAAISDPIPVAESPVDPEQEARRQARQRDREVRAILRQIIGDLIAEYDADGRGVEIREIAGGYRMATKPECHDAVRLFVKSLKPPLKLSLPALETLAVIAYKQPVTAPEVNEIRGVDSSGVFGSLIARKLIATAGRKQVIGRPILYKTTREFLLRFGLKDVAELPSMEEFEKMAAIELEESEPQLEPASNEEAPSSENLDFNPDSDEAASEEPEAPATESEAPAPNQTAETAASPEVPPSQEAAPAAPHSPEQVETENLPHGEEEHQNQ
ncbi:MAG: SMC-Scp complex subunit ScpB [Terracidiphilus sp.]|jgi:segregation and condensation protein B